MPVWTDEQLEAINSYGFPVIVSAAAGSGKTAVLVERTIRLLCDEKLNIPADSLLAVTFTNDAASQMREKLSIAFEKAAEQNPDSLWIQKQQSLLSLSDICTINSFCFDMVRNNLCDTDFQNGIRIMEESESKMITERALDIVMENAYLSRPDELEELISLFCRENDSALREIILKLYGFRRTLPFEKTWTAGVVRSLSDGTQLDRIMRSYMQRAKEQACILGSLSDRLRKCASKLTHYSAASMVFEKCCSIAESIAGIPHEMDWDGCVSVFSGLSWPDLRGARQSKAEKLETDTVEAELYEETRRCLEQLKAKARDIADCYRYTVARSLEDAAQVKGCFEKLSMLTDELEAQVHSIKVERNAVDFADTELMTVRLLAECEQDGEIKRTALAEEIRSSSKYKLILIDEFQDVNNLQEVIFKAISDSDDMGCIGKNVFAVGDVKQAIYRFRQANPMILMNTRIQGRRGEGGIRELLLTRNFRSRGAVLDIVNYLFSSLMTSYLGEVDYTSSEMLRLGADYSKEDPESTIIVIDSDCDDGTGETKDEFCAVAAKIRSMLDSGITVKDKDGIRQCRPGDFCVLTRNNVEADTLRDSFAACGLSIASSGVSGYLSSREISLTLNLLSVIVSPMRDIPLASVMLSPILGFSDDDIAVIRLHDRTSRLYKNILELASCKSIDKNLSQKCNQAVSLIKRLRIMNAELSLTELIKRMYDLTDMFSMAAQYEDGEHKCANLYLLLEYAQSYENSSNDGASGFLRYIEYIQRTGGDFSQALLVTESEDSVAVKTIHKSKGLEYPFVFVCQLSKRFNRRDLYGRLVLSTDGGVGFSFLDYSTLSKRSTIYSDYIALKNEKELLSEELRLLYVALTRAKEQLFIVLDINEKTIERAAGFSYEIVSDKVPDSVSEKAICVKDWIIMAMLKHPQFTCIRERIPNSLYTDISRIPQIVVENAMRISKAQDSVDVLCERSSENNDALQLADDILRSFGYENDSRLCNSEAKMSVSELVSDDSLTFFPEVPDLDETIGEISAAQKGTLMHRFMQLCDLEAAGADIAAEISRLTSSGVFTPLEAEALDRRSLMAFFESDIFSRLRQSLSVMREKSFIVRFCDINVDERFKEKYEGTDGMLQGIADCIFEEEDGYVLVDYKTDRVRNLDELKKRYAEQLSLYKAAFDILLDKPIKSCCIYSYRLSDGIEVCL